MKISKAGALALLALSTNRGDAGNPAAFWAAAPGRRVDPAAVPRSALSNSGAAGPQRMSHPCSTRAISPHPRGA